MPANTRLPDVQMPKEVPIIKYSFVDYFKGFETVSAVREIFGDQTANVLSELQVEFFGTRFGYMGVAMKMDMCSLVQIT